MFIFLGPFFSLIMTLSTAASDMISFGSMVYVAIALVSVGTFGGNGNIY